MGGWLDVWIDRRMCEWTGVWAGVRVDGRRHDRNKDTRRTDKNIVEVTDFSAFQTVNMFKL
jgi:hypothetical protein